MAGNGWSAGSVTGGRTIESLSCDRYEDWGLETIVMAVTILLAAWGFLMYREMAIVVSGSELYRLWFWFFATVLGLLDL